MYTVYLAGCEDIGGIAGDSFSRTCEFQTFRDISSLLKGLQDAPADLVILDLDLPGSRSARTAAALPGAIKNAALLFAGDQALFDSSHPLTAIPAMDYLLRPFSAQEVILTLEAALSLCERRKQAEEAPQRLHYVRTQIQRYLQEHYGEDLSMQDVAQVMNYSETHFCRLFKQCFKVNFSVYLNEFRVEQAKQLLRGTNLNVKEIAQRCGYQDNSYFIRVFKRFTGMTPVDYRISL